MAAAIQLFSACFIFSYFICSGYSAILGQFSINSNLNDKIKNNKGPNEIFALTYFSSYQDEGNIILSQFQQLGDNIKPNLLESSVKILGINQNLSGVNQKVWSNDEKKALSDEKKDRQSQRENEEKFIVVEIIKNEQSKISEDFFQHQNKISNLTLLQQKPNENTNSPQNDHTISPQQTNDSGSFLSFNKFPPFYFITLPRYNGPKKISKDFPYYQFTDVGFYHSLPKQFIDGEVFRFEGIVTDYQLLKQNRYPKIYIIFLGKNVNHKNVCVSPILYSLEFNMSCQMRNAGKYSMSVIVGKTMTTSPILRTVNSQQNLIISNTQENYDPEPKGLSIKLINNSLYLVWDSNASLTNLTIYQKKNEKIIKKEYLLSNYHSIFKIPFKDFNDFQPITTYVQISHAKSLNGSLNIIYTKFTNQKTQITFQAVDHAFQEIALDLLMEPELPWKIEVGQKIKVNMTFSQEIRNTLYITRPDLKLQKVLIMNLLKNSTSIKAGTEISLQFSFSRPGTYIIQINNLGGIAVVNRPIYVGPGYPLIPDYKDLITESQILNNRQAIERIYEAFYQRTTEKIKTRQPQKNSSIALKRQYLLNLINGLRRKYNVSQIMIDETLNKIAQSQSDDMVARNFFGHANPDGDRVNQRAKKFNFSLIVNQNLARSTYLSQNHLGLERSAVHLQNTINKIWTRVGIGISMNNNKQYLISYIFSVRDLLKFPLTQKEYIKFYDQLVKGIIEKNSKKREMVEDKGLSLDIKQWIESESNVALTKYLEMKKKYGKLSGLSFRVGYTDDWVEKLKQGNILQIGPQKRQFGVGLGMKKQNGGLLETYIVLL